MDYTTSAISFNLGESYIESHKWINDKKATTNPQNNDDNCFQYMVTVALNHESIGKHPERIAKIEPDIDKYKER